MHRSSGQELRRVIPKVDRLLEAPELAPLLARHPRARVLHELRAILEELRRRAGAGDLAAAELEAGALAEALGAALERAALPFYRPVVNATGVVLHTGIGRAALPREAVAALVDSAGGSQRLEIDLETGERGGRDEGCAALLRELTGCEAATVVNNNAGATLLILAALARGGKVVLSRGEMVEIGGSFRIPEVLSESGARLVEVGTTNRTHLRDYRDALDGLDGDTALILKVHPSNYRIEGFTSEVPLDELAALGRERGVPVVHDLGSGCLVDLAGRGLPGEWLVQRSIAAGADLVCFSGDKLLGGPQCGLIAGRREAVDRCRRHPLMRALRPGRLTYTALEATLRLYRDGLAAERVPALRRLLAGEEELRRRADRLALLLEPVAGLAAAVAPCASQAGSGSLPAREIPSWGVRLEAAGLTAAELARRLRTGVPAILPRVADDAVLLDVRTLDDDELPAIARRLAEICGADGRAPDA